MATSEIYTSGSESSEDTVDFSCPKKRYKYMLQTEANLRVWSFPVGDIDVLDPPVPADVKKRVKADDPCKGRCLITNASYDSGIKYTHCLPVHLAEDSNLMRRIEWHWGVRMHELDLDAECNIFPVSAQLSAMHEYPRRGPSWFLVPEDHIVDMYFSQVRKLDIKRRPCDSDEETPMFARTWRGNLPSLPDKTHRYRLFPMYKRMKGMCLTYYQETEGLPQPNDFIVDVHPFNRLPWVTSHLDPKYVIMEAGRKIKLLDAGNLKWGVDFGRWFDHQPILRRLLLLYEAWTEPIPREAYQDPGFVPFADDLRANTGSPAVGDHKPGVPDSARKRGGWDPPSIAQWSIDASAQASAPDAFPGVDASNDVAHEDDDQAMDSDDNDSQFDFGMSAGDRTPPGRAILSKQRWY